MQNQLPIYLALIIMFLALIIMLAMAVWREFVSSQRQKAIDSGLLQIRTEQARIAAAISAFSEKVSSVFDGMSALKENGDKAADFAMKAEQDMTYLRSEFATVVAYRKEAAQQFDHVEGL